MNAERQAAAAERATAISYDNLARKWERTHNPTKAADYRSRAAAARRRAAQHDTNAAENEAWGRVNPHLPAYEDDPAFKKAPRGPRWLWWLLATALAIGVAWLQANRGLLLLAMSLATMASAA